MNIDITPTTEVVVRLYGTFDNLTGPVDGGEQIYNKVMRTNPVLYPAYYLPNEALRHTQHILFGNFEEGGYLNPYADMVKGYQESTSSKMIAQFEAHQDLGFLLDGLSVRALQHHKILIIWFHNSIIHFTTRWGYDEATGDYSLYKINPLEGTEFLNIRDHKECECRYVHGVATSL